MKKIWSDTPEDIIKELGRLTEESIGLTMCQKGSDNRLVTLKRIEAKRVGHVLAFEKGEEFDVLMEPALFFYKPAEYLTRGFQGQPLKNIGRFFSMNVPTIIFEVGMRKFPRVDTPKESSASFSRPGTTKIVTCKILDVSMAGAMFVGDIPDSIKKGDRLGPITCTLFMNFSSEETNIRIGEAVVRNVIQPKGGGPRKVGVQFDKDDLHGDDLENYIDIRDIEENVSGDGF